MKLNELVLKYILNYEKPDSFVSKLRRKRILKLFELIEEVFLEKGQVNIIDIGGRPAYWSRNIPLEFIDKFKIIITIVHLPNEKHLQTDSSSHFKYISADGCDLSFIGANQYDIAHSNSVIEHVGDWPRMVSFSKEVRRIAERYYVQTPSFWFPVEPHVMFPFFHWLPKPIRVWLLMKFSLGNWNKCATVNEAVLWVESARLLDKKMFISLFPNSNLIEEKLFLLTKSFVAISK